jgi:hypothetical protein
MEHKLKELMFTHLPLTMQDFLLNFLQGIQKISGGSHFLHKGFRGHRYEILPDYRVRRLEAQLQKDKLYALAKRRCCQIV